jgi:hypothetical protein
VQFHQDALVARTNDYNPGFTATVSGIARAMERAGASSMDATHKALSLVYRQVQQQAATLAYLDALKCLAIATALMIPLLLLTRRPKGRAAPAGGH